METEQLVQEVVEVIGCKLRARLPRSGRIDDANDVDVEALGSQAVDWLLAALYATSGTSPLARRIGPVYSSEDLARWLVAPGSEPLTTQAVRKRAKGGQLVGFLTDDRQWAFPAWQFDRAAGRLVPRSEVVALWRQLPRDSFLSDVDLAAWMNTELRSLRKTPAAYADRHGADAVELGSAVSRLRRRAA
ncbi:MAG TPA: hypothetical protein VGA69_02620 [Nitriliruptorales bacterium]